MRVIDPKDPVLAALSGLVLGFGSLLWVFFGSGIVSGTRVEHAVGGWLSSHGTTAAPATPAFGIWWLIYIGLAAYLIWQYLPRNRADQLHRYLRPWAVASLVLNALWLQMIQWNQLGLSLVVMFVLAAVLTTVLRLVGTQILYSATDRWVTRATFGIYYGWILLAFIANLTAWLSSLGIAAITEALKPLTALLILLTGLAICAMTFKNPLGIYVNVGSLWAMVWIAVARFNGPLYSAPVALSALIAATLLLICLLSSLRHRIGRLLRETFQNGSEE